MLNGLFKHHSQVSSLIRSYKKTPDAGLFLGLGGPLKMKSAAIKSSNKTSICHRPVLQLFTVFPLQLIVYRHGIRFSISVRATPLRSTGKNCHQTSEQKIF